MPLLTGVDVVEEAWCLRQRELKKGRKESEARGRGADICSIFERPGLGEFDPGRQQAVK